MTMPMQVSTTGQNAALLPPATFETDGAAEIAELSVESGAAEQDSENRIESTENTFAQQESDAEVAELRKKAGEMWTQGLVDGCTTMGEGAFEAGSAACNFKAAESPGGSSSAAAQSLNAQAGWYKSGATGLQGSAKVADGLFGEAETNADAASKQAEQSATRANDAARSAHDGASSAQQSVSHLLETAQQIEETQAQASLAIWRRA
jgi:hypothetical protein